MVGVMMPLTKQTYMPLSVDEIETTIHEAMYVASSGRGGPVVVDITKDAQFSRCRWAWDDKPVQLPGYRPEYRPQASDCDRALELIHAAKRPIVFCGHGIIKANASAELLEFANKSQIPVASTLLGLGGFPASHPLSLGMMGMHGEAWIKSAI